MSWVTHELLIAGQSLGGCAYTLASRRLWQLQLDRLTLGLLAMGVSLDVVLAVLGTTSDLGDNPDGVPWSHPLFALAVGLATGGMVGYMVCLVLIAVGPWRARAATFLRYSQLVIWPSWMAGVALFILNVYVEWF